LEHQQTKFEYEVVKGKFRTHPRSGLVVRTLAASDFSATVYFQKDGYEGV